MQFDPPRAEKKYSRTLDFEAAQFHHWFMGRLPRFLKFNPNSAVLPALTAAVFSVIPGLGHFYITQKWTRPLVCFAVCLFLMACFFFTFGTNTGVFITMLLFGFHQFLMFQSYQMGLLAAQAPLPDLKTSMWISLVMTLALLSIYSALYVPLQPHLFCAANPLGDKISTGDRFWVDQENSYRRGDIVTFKQSIQFRDSYVEDENVLERILAGPGDNITEPAGTLLVNGQPLPDDLQPLETGLSFTGPGLTVPDGFFFVLFGIKTNMTYNPGWFLVAKEKIQGKLAFRYFPTWENFP
jgi:hypothetical protein